MINKGGGDSPPKFRIGGTHLFLYIKGNSRFKKARK